MKLVLFDIDGTLLWTDGAGRRAIQRALVDEAGTAGPIETYRFDGKTDPQIVRDLLSLAGHSGAENPTVIQAVCRRYVEHLRTELERPTQATRLMVGIADLLAALEPHETQGRALVGLLTGNVAPGAALKLRSAGLDPARFRVGAYGSDSARRAELPAVAAGRAAALTGATFTGSDVIIVGDTPDDVACGGPIGARSLAVATGSYHVAALRATGRRQSGLRRVGVEGATLATREVPPPRRSGDARCGPRLRGDHPRAAGVCGVGAHRPSRGGVSARPGRATPRVVSGDGCAARGRRRAVRDRARDRGDGPRPGPLSSRVAAVFRGPVRSPYGSGRPPRAMSASVKIPMPLRVPELAPSLGQVLVPRRLEEPWVPLDDIREELATRVIELGGEARAAAAGEDRDRVLDAVSRRAWLGAWETAVRRAGERVTAALGGEIERAARRVRMPRRLLRRRLLTGPEKRAIAARLAAGGEPLVAALDALDAVATRVREASVLDKAAHAEWQEALRTAARRLEAAWLALETQVADEHRRWADEIDAVARWRPSLWPLVTLWTPLGVALVWLGLVLGGYLPAPAWLAARLGF